MSGTKQRTYSEEESSEPRCRHQREQGNLQNHDRQSGEIVQAKIKSHKRALQSKQRQRKANANRGEEYAEKSGTPRNGRQSETVVSSHTISCFCYGFRISISPTAITSAPIWERTATWPAASTMPAVPKLAM
jgi:hypothetical protein